MFECRLEHILKSVHKTIIIGKKSTRIIPIWLFGYVLHDSIGTYTRYNDRVLKLYFYCLILKTVCNILSMFAIENVSNVCFQYT